MGNPFIPLAPPIQDPLQQYGRMMQLKALAQQQQLFPGQLQAQQQQLQSGALTVQQQQLQLARTKALNDAFAGAVSTDANGNPTFDRQKVIQSVAQSGQGAAIPDLNKSFMELDKLAGEVQDTRDKHNAAALDYMGSAAKVIQAANYDPTVAGSVLAHAATAGYKDEAQRLVQAINQNPSIFKQLIDQTVQMSPKQAETFKNIQQGNLAQAETRQKQPFDPQKIAQLNAGMQQGWQVLHPGQPLPPAYQLGPNATQADFQRLDALMKNEQQSAATQAQRQVANGLRQQAMSFQQGMAKQNQSQKSYQFSASQLDKVGQPIDQLVQRMSRLKDTLAQANPQADALVAPELLTVMAGGMGSGLRMNEAEISRIVGGRNAWESLKSRILKYQSDPSKPFLITPVQRQQVNGLLDEVNRKLLSKQQVLDQARQDLSNSDDPGEHKQIVTKARAQLTKIDESAGQPPAKSSNDPFAAFGGSRR